MTAEGHDLEHVHSDLQLGDGQQFGDSDVKIDKTAPTGRRRAPLARGPDSDGWYNHPVAPPSAGRTRSRGSPAAPLPTYGGRRQRDGAALGHVHRRRREHERRRERRAQVRRHASDGDARAGAGSRSRGLVPEAADGQRSPGRTSLPGSRPAARRCATRARTSRRRRSSGSCRDHAGNAAEAGHTFPFDASAPKLAKPKVSRGAGEITIAWPRPMTSPRRRSCARRDSRARQSSVVYTGKASRFVDKSVQAGEPLPLSARRRGSRREQVGPGTPPPARSLLSISRRQARRSAAPPLLALAGRRGGEVLQRPAAPQRGQGAQQLAARRRNSGSAGHGGTAGSGTARAGSYRWYVWGARGTRERPTYGPRLGRARSGSEGVARDAARVAARRRIVTAAVVVHPDRAAERARLLHASPAINALAPARPGSASASRSTGTAGTNGWYTSNVTIRGRRRARGPRRHDRAATAAELITVRGYDEHTVHATCSHGGRSRPTVTMKIDKTLPDGSGSGTRRAGPTRTAGTTARSASASRATDAVSGMDICTGGSYSGPDSATASATGICTDHAGNMSTGAFSLPYDSTAPGWRRGVGARSGRERLVQPLARVSNVDRGPGDVSGSASCSPAASYSGPDSVPRQVSGTCTDRAGNTSVPLDGRPEVRRDAADEHGGGRRRGRRTRMVGSTSADDLVPAVTGTDATSGSRAARAAVRATLGQTRRRLAIRARARTGRVTRAAR